MQRLSSRKTRKTHGWRTNNGNIKPCRQSSSYLSTLPHHNRQYGMTNSPIHEGHNMTRKVIYSSSHRYHASSTDKLSNKLTYTSIMRGDPLGLDHESIRQTRLQTSASLLEIQTEQKGPPLSPRPSADQNKAIDDGLPGRKDLSTPNGDWHNDSAINLSDMDMIDRRVNQSLLEPPALQGMGGDPFTIPSASKSISFIDNVQSSRFSWYKQLRALPLASPFACDNRLLPENQEKCLRLSSVALSLYPNIPKNVIPPLLLDGSITLEINKACAVSTEARHRAILDSLCYQPTVIKDVHLKYLRSGINLLTTSNVGLTLSQLARFDRRNNWYGHKSAWQFGQDYTMETLRDAYSEFRLSTAKMNQQQADLQFQYQQELKLLSISKNSLNQNEVQDGGPVDTSTAKMAGASADHHTANNTQQQRRQIQEQLYRLPVPQFTHHSASEQYIIAYINELDEFLLANGDDVGLFLKHQAAYDASQGSQNEDEEESVSPTSSTQSPDGAAIRPDERDDLPSKHSGTHNHDHEAIESPLTNFSNRLNLRYAKAPSLDVPPVLNFFNLVQLTAVLAEVAIIERQLEQQHLYLQQQQQQIQNTSTDDNLNNKKRTPSTPGQHPSQPVSMQAPETIDQLTDILYNAITRKETLAAGMAPLFPAGYLSHLYREMTTNRMAPELLRCLWALAAYSRDIIMPPTKAIHSFPQLQDSPHHMSSSSSFSSLFDIRRALMSTLSHIQMIPSAVLPLSYLTLDSTAGFLPKDLMYTNVLSGVVGMLKPHTQVYLCQSIPDIRTSEKFCQAVMSMDTKPVLLSYRLSSDDYGVPRLLSCETLSQAIDKLLVSAPRFVDGYLFNCSTVSSVTAGLPLMKKVTRKSVGAFAKLPLALHACGVGGSFIKTHHNNDYVSGSKIVHSFPHLTSSLDESEAYQANVSDNDDHDYQWHPQAQTAADVSSHTSQPSFHRFTQLTTEMEQGPDASDREGLNMTTGPTFTRNPLGKRNTHGQPTLGNSQLPFETPTTSSAEHTPHNILRAATEIYRRQQPKSSSSYHQHSSSDGSSGAVVPDNFTNIAHVRAQPPVTPTPRTVSTQDDHNHREHSDSQVQTQHNESEDTSEKDPSPEPQSTSAEDWAAATKVHQTIPMYLKKIRSFVFEQQHDYASPLFARKHSLEDSLEDAGHHGDSDIRQLQYTPEKPRQKHVPNKGLVADPDMQQSEHIKPIAITYGSLLKQASITENADTGGQDVSPTHHHQNPPQVSAELAHQQQQQQQQQASEPSKQLPSDAHRHAEGLMTPKDRDGTPITYNDGDDGDDGDDYTQSTLSIRDSPFFETDQRRDVSRLITKVMSSDCDSVREHYAKLTLYWSTHLSAEIVGGCCGVDIGHVEAMRTSIDTHYKQQLRSWVADTVNSSPLDGISTNHISKLADHHPNVQQM